MGESASKLMASMESRAAAAAAGGTGLPAGLNMESLLQMGRAAFSRSSANTLGASGGASGGGAGEGSGSVGDAALPSDAPSPAPLPHPPTVHNNATADFGSGVAASNDADRMAAAAQLFAQFGGGAGVGAGAGRGSAAAASMPSGGAGADIASMLLGGMALHTGSNRNNEGCNEGSGSSYPSEPPIPSAIIDQHGMKAAARCECCAAATLAAEAARVETVALAAQLSRLEKKLDMLVNGLQHMLPPN